MTIRSPVSRKATLAESFLGEFVPRFVPGGKLVYARGGNDPCDGAALQNLGMDVDLPRIMPDLIFHDAARDWLLIVECASGKCLIDEMRLEELHRIFSQAKPDLIYVTAFQGRSNLADYADLPAWGTHAWFADEPDHMMHFDGSRFLGPYA